MSLGDDSIQSVFDLVNELRTLIVRLDGTPTQPGVIAETGQLARSISAVVENMGQLADRLAAAADLHTQLGSLPAQLLRPDECESFRGSVREAMSNELAAAVEAARGCAAEAGVSIAIGDLRTMITSAIQDAEATVFGGEGSRVELFYRVKKADSEIKRLMGVNEKLSSELQRISSLHRGEMTARDEKNQGLLAAAYHSGQRSAVVCLLTGLLAGVLAGTGYLAPQIQGWLASELIYKPIHQGR